MKYNEPWYEQDWFLALITLISAPLIMFVICALGISVYLLRSLRELIWLEYKSFLLLINEISWEELEDFIDKREKAL